MAIQQQQTCAAEPDASSGYFTDLDGERFYAIDNVDHMAPFFISLVSHGDHWLFASSNGALTAGRVSPETALFPYVTVDKIHDSACHTGCKTIIAINDGPRHVHWEPFADLHHGSANVTRTLYKNTLGNKLRFEETNHALNLTFRYTWSFSDEFGFIRQCELVNLSDQACSVDIVDGFENILPAGTPRFAQTNTSNLVDAYKWSELDETTGLALFTLYSGITDRAEPCESLRANTVFCQGLNTPTYLLQTDQLAHFLSGVPLVTEHHTRGTRGCYFVNAQHTLAPEQTLRWHFAANIEQDQAHVVALAKTLDESTDIAAAMTTDIAQGSQILSETMASCDARQLTAEENVSVHHYANVLFNVLRGGVFDDHYNIYPGEFARTLRLFDRHLAQRHDTWLSSLPQKLPYADLLESVNAQGDTQLQRLTQEYLPIRFGRRHGDPSRPWNQFAIELNDEDGKRILSYQGNWRDIFQNWEALTFSYPGFIENVIAKFVNASTMDGFNPYRITDEGIDWEVEEPDDPWSYIGYWGDHQIIYLQKLLELSQQFHPDRLAEMLEHPLYCYANVPYRIKPFGALLADAKNTVDYDEATAQRIEARVRDRGADGKLVLDAEGAVYLTTLLEKLLVPLLSKLGNLVIDGGIWLNTQRPEWNDANNALVGQGLSMVTLYYLRRYVTFLTRLTDALSPNCTLSNEVGRWLYDTGAALREQGEAMTTDARLSSQARYSALERIGKAASHYRETIYTLGTFSGKSEYPLTAVQSLLADALQAIDHCVRVNQRDDGMFHAYNTLSADTHRIDVEPLYPMLEGQVAVLSSGALDSDTALGVIQSLFDSDIYRADQHSFMLYPDRRLTGFLNRNQINEDTARDILLARRMLDAGDTRVILRDAAGSIRFNADLTNARELVARLELLRDEYGSQIDTDKDALRTLYEHVFDHQAFTGRSGTMFGFEGLGCIYWHMVSKLLLAVQETYFKAIADNARKDVIMTLAQRYYDVRAGIGFNKTPAEYGAFPTDPYSHTPRHAGAQQPGMTGQVKEEVLARFGELGIRVKEGQLHIEPSLLRRQEFLRTPGKFEYMDIAGATQIIDVPTDGIAFTWCQVPIVYVLGEDGDEIAVSNGDGTATRVPGLTLSRNMSDALFARNAEIRQLTVTFSKEQISNLSAH
ncbi:MAG: hypothetical protein AAF004_09310 [Pseudomonadota bacterium]